MSKDRDSTEDVYAGLIEAQRQFLEAGLKRLADENEGLAAQVMEGMNTGKGVVQIIFEVPTLSVKTYFLFKDKAHKPICIFAVEKGEETLN